MQTLPQNGSQISIQETGDGDWGWGLTASGHEGIFLWRQRYSETGHRTRQVC